MRNPLLHALNIGTLALWLTVAGFGGVAIWVPGFTREVVISEDGIASLSVEDFSVGDSGEIEPGERPPGPREAAMQETLETLASPPEIPTVSEFDPLPEIPDLPAFESQVEHSNRPEPKSRPSPVGKPTPSKPSKAAGTGRTSAPGKAAGDKPSTGSGMSVAARLAAGRMPAPAYPPYSRRNHQAGTVVVQFTIGTNGQVVAASVYKSSNWPLLDREALRAVRSWKFPPGDVMTNIKPITFTLK